MKKHLKYVNVQNIYIKLKCTTIGAITSTVRSCTLQIAYVRNGSQHSTVVQKVPFDSFTPLQLCTKVTGFISSYQHKLLHLCS